MTDAFSRIGVWQREIMLPYARKLGCKIDREDELYVDTRCFIKDDKPLWFGGVQIKKNYVSFHLMPVYVKPKLLEKISPALKQRMEGKSCFTFLDASLFKALAALTAAGFRDYEKRGYV